MIQVENIAKKFIRQKKKGKKEEFFAVDHISFEAREGEILGILGPNGAGKTTLLRMLGNLMEPTAGGVVMKNGDGEVISNAIEQKRRIGYLSENTKLYGRFTVRELLRIFEEIYGLDREKTEERIEKVSDILDMESFLDNRIEKLSTGQKQRSNIARCLIHDPEIYIFDEPTLGLDIISSKAIIDFMEQEKGRGKTILYSTHYMEEAQTLCDRILMMHKGKIVAEGTPEELMQKTGTRSLRETFFQIVGEHGLEESEDE